jgi:DNA repair protein RecO (recombination protein O)
MDNRPFRESDSRISAYSLERGSVDLVARGTLKSRSKLAAHLQPISLVEIMAIRGRSYDYVGSAVVLDAYPVVKSDLSKVMSAGNFVRVLGHHVRPADKDEEVYRLACSFFSALNKSNNGTSLLEWLHMFRLVCILGYKPEMGHCLLCGQVIKPQSNRLDLIGGGLVCAKCGCQEEGRHLPVSEGCIKALRFAATCDIADLSKLQAGPPLRAEVAMTVNKYIGYCIA